MRPQDFLPLAGETPPGEPGMADDLKPIAPPAIIDPKTTPVPSMFGRVLRKDDALGLRETLLGYKMLTGHLAPRVHMATGERGSITIGIQLGAGR